MAKKSLPPMPPVKAPKDKKAKNKSKGKNPFAKAKGTMPGTPSGFPPMLGM